ncbi:MAG: cation:proton antiporter, partial [Myxococcota bacterium]
MDLTWIGIAFLFGVVLKQLGQAPLLGFLAAGFAMSELGLDPDPTLPALANFGVQLLLFAIGLKLDLRSLLRPHVMGASLLHTAAFTAVSAGVLAVPRALGVGALGGLSGAGLVVVAFVGCFSSTLFSVKILEERDNLGALYGRVIIGFLVVQDLVAVAYLGITKGTVPSPWAVGLLGLVLLRPLIARALEAAGHRELLVLLGVALTLGGAELFGAVGLKEDLGPLVAGALVGGMPKAKELSEVLLSLKDLLLVGFFVTIGLGGLPGVAELGLAFGLVLLLPLKGGLFMWLFTRFGLRARSAWLASLGLTPYSEFGLIVAAVAVKKGWLGPSWLVTLAVAMGLSFIPMSLINRRAFAVFARFRAAFVRLESGRRIPEEEPVRVGPARVLAFGLGAVGASAYARAREAVGDEGLVG